MGNEVELSPAAVKVRVRELESLLTRLDKISESLREVRRRQGRQAWSAIFHCGEFDSSYARSIGDLHETSLKIRTKVGVIQVSLQESADSLARTDQDIQDKLTILANRIEDEPPLPRGGAGAAGGSGAQPAGLEVAPAPFGYQSLYGDRATILAARLGGQASFGGGGGSF